MLKLFHSPASPFVRKALILAHERGIADRIELLTSAAHPINRDMAIVAKNPTGKIPTMLLEDGSAIYDSRVICEYLDSLPGGAHMIPPPGPARWKVLTLAALCDEVLDACILCRYETFARPEEKRWPEWIKGQQAKIFSSLDAIEKDWLAHLAANPVDMGSITLGCLIGYLGLRFPELDWRTGRPGLARWHDSFLKRPSMQATLPKG